MFNVSKCWQTLPWGVDPTAVQDELCGKTLFYWEGMGTVLFKLQRTAHLSIE